MTVVFIVLLIASLLEASLYFVSPVWTHRKYMVPLIIVGVAFGSGGIFAENLNVAAGLLLLVSAYRVFNVLRIAENRINEHHLRRATRLTSYWLMGMQSIILSIWWVAEKVQFYAGNWVVLLAVVQLIAAVVLAASTYRQFIKTRPLTTRKTYADRDLPSITVAIPARNEDQQLETCLQTLLASDYPKLEVLVLDDCSQDRTSQIIKNFAHDGVRFIPGEAPKDSWLAKNQAYERLAAESSGDLILFCGVDVRFAPQSIRQIVTLLEVRHKQMLCVMPLNEQLKLSFAQSIRYYWELALPRRVFNRPPILSSCWLITANFLKANGGFAAVSNSIAPEAHFARNAVKKDGYTFMRSTAHLGVTSVKGSLEQCETAVRVRYPQVHRRPELVLLVAVTELLLLFAPYLLLIVGLWGVFGLFAEILFILGCILLTATYRTVTYATSSRDVWYLSPLFPITVLIDIGLLHYSMNKYEFSTVEWKGRNVCIPVMNPIRHLPELNK
jgi:glycosyltransferase involved in cell wall biosynthesis